MAEGLCGEGAQGYYLEIEIKSGAAAFVDCLHAALSLLIGGMYNGPDDYAWMQWKNGTSD